MTHEAPGARVDVEPVLVELDTQSGDRLMTFVIIAVTLIGVLSTVGVIVLATQDRSTPDVLQNLAIGSLTALAGLLAGRRS